MPLTAKQAHYLSSQALNSDPPLVLLVQDLDIAFANASLDLVMRLGCNARACTE